MDQKELEDRVAALEKALSFMLDRFDQPGNTFSQRLACTKARNVMPQAVREKQCPTSRPNPPCTA